MKQPDKKINVLFDATWIGKYFGSKTMHGGLRVVIELTKRLVQHEACNTHFISTNVNHKYYDNLSVYIQEFLQHDIDAVKTDYRKNMFFARLLSKIPKSNRVINHGITFPLKKNSLKPYNVYHSPVDPIPDVIKSHKKIKPFLTALDLIPLVKPEYSYPGFTEYLKSVYGSINEDTIVLAISESTKHDLLNYRNDIKADNVIVTYVAADDKVFYPNNDPQTRATILSKYGIAFDKYFFTLNALAKYKNIEHVITSFIEYIEEVGQKDTGLVIIGHNRETNFRQSLQFKYRQYPQVQFIENVSDNDLSVIYSNSRAFLYMSLYEGFGLPILEAMQCGVPVICSNTSSMPEVIGDCGICIDPLDKDLLTASIARIDNDDKFRNQCIRKGLTRSKMFSWDNYTSDVVSAYLNFAY